MGPLNTRTAANHPATHSLLCGALLRIFQLSRTNHAKTINLTVAGLEFTSRRTTAAKESEEWDADSLTK